MTDKERIVVMGYTGTTMVSFSKFQTDVERRLGEPLSTFAFASPEFVEKVKSLYKDDFIELCKMKD
jgi:hypothetical protein